MIGVFDSGSGGLTVLKALRAALPDQRFIYYGDHIHAPYGDRDADSIYNLTLSCLTQLFGLGCSLVVIACNTASATGLRRLQQTWLPVHFPHKRVIGVIVPMVEALTGVPWLTKHQTDAHRSIQKTVGVFATQYTVHSQIFVEETQRRAPGIHVVQQACPDLVQLIEEDARLPDLRHSVQHYVAQLQHSLNGAHLSAALLGCTHYPLIEDIFAEALPDHVEIFSQPKITADSLVTYLSRHPEFSDTKESGILFYSSSNPDNITARAKRFFGDDKIRFEQLPPPHGASPAIQVPGILSAHQCDTAPQIFTRNQKLHSDGVQ
ncbi:glutamate racemase [Alcaligenaceae bacterium CGII-47]|nr:glutamate racemase [Alcaligenaceae bacterium CGII-47]